MKYIKAILSAAVTAAVTLSIVLTAAAQENPQKTDIWYSAYCRTYDDVTAALETDSTGVTLAGELEYTKVYEMLGGRKHILVDAANIEEAEAVYNEVLSNGEAAFETTVFRIRGGANKVIKWAESKEIRPTLMGFYSGNIYFSALACIKRYSEYGKIAAVQLQTGNQDGVILHNTVTFMFDKTEVDGVFSFVDTAKSAKRTDTARSWDDLMSRGYSVFETAYPQDFSEYLADNTAEYIKLEESVEKAKIIDISTAYPNRVSAYESALEAAEALLADGSCAIYEMADARAVLDEAVANLNVDDGKKVKGDFEITPGRAAWALFGVALVLSWQIYFRKKWGKKA